MGLIVRPFNYVAGAIIVATQNNSNETTLYNLVNGNIEDANLGLVTESAITFNGSGHDHSGGTDGSIIDISGAGFLLRCATTGIDHAIIGRSSSAGAHAGIRGDASTASAYAGNFDHTAAGTTLLVDCSGGGTCMLIQNASGVAANHTMNVKHRGTTAARSGIYIDEVTSSGYGIWIDGVDGDGIRINQSGAGGSTNAIEVLDNRSATPLIATVNLEKDNTSGSGHVLQVSTVVNSGTTADAALRVQGGEYGLLVENHVNSETGAQVAIFRAEPGGVTALAPPTGGWFRIEGNGGVQDNCAFFDGYVKIEGSLHCAGGTKLFTNPHPHRSDKGLAYVCLEGPENGIYWRSRGVTVPGDRTIDPSVCRIPLPDYVVLASVEGEEMDVLVTPRKRCSINAYHDVEKQEIVVECDTEGVRFSILCFGTRRYFEDHEVVVDADWTDLRADPTSCAAKAYGALN
jgi:hypothetical protein